MIKKLTSYFGPGTFVAAAFIGPGTITICSIAGVKFGTDLIWALVLSILATIVLQNMSARIGLVTQKDLGTAMRHVVRHPVLKSILMFLVVVAIVFGNAAYEAGNISGAVMGFSVIYADTLVSIGGFQLDYLPLLIGVICFFILNMNSYKKIENVLIVLVVLMSLSFLTTAIITQPSYLALLQGVFLFNMPSESLTTVLAIVGTTIVPYNLFLHSSIVQEKWNGVKALSAAKWDSAIAIGLGGIVSIAVVVAASRLPKAELLSILDMAETLEPLYGVYAKYLLGFGFFAAGITSTLTAALAAAYVLKGCLGWKIAKSHPKFKWTWRGILFLGVFFSSLGINPIELIQIAQVSNAILLPFIAILLLAIVSNQKLMGEFKNTWLQNAVGILIVLFCLFLSFKSFFMMYSS
ncbi:Nramp family divalent metal transporter [Psychroflexus sediminis]|uniref:NRAMP (Natural resistance-associated macrophage protein) metal ion transporters n=1 Tax=Psychroflexus sediminis TaxID=470826 RepID=A0A1G7V9T6_9FLAO|nr:Nramp family divalent metal transporter [Psychroflexus sediminis]SDG56556.1 NRAMP (natural resistance-associated macrophage protein) metal ion transporters [Psychroflexus sediminis]